MNDRSFEPLTRKDKAVYWVLRLMPTGVAPYDFRADWQDYLQHRSVRRTFFTEAERAR